MAATKKPARKPMVPRKPSTAVKVNMPKTTSAKPAVKTPMPKVTSPSRRNVIPPDYDVILPGMGYTKPTKKSPPKKIKKK